MLSKNEWYISILLIVPFIIIPFIWDQLPAQMATHWNLQGEVNGTSSKSFGLLFVPLLNMGLYFLFLYLPVNDPKRRQTHQMASYLLVAGGFLLLILFPMLTADAYFYCFMNAAIGISLIPCIYSFYLYKTKS